jgi:hypothetical protein
MAWVDSVVIVARQDAPLWMYESEKGWNASLLSASNATLWSHDWAPGTSPYPAVYLKASLQQPPPPPLAASPPLAQSQNTPCEGPASLPGALP